MCYIYEADQHNFNKSKETSGYGGKSKPPQACMESTDVTEAYGRQDVAEEFN